jgi:Predicted periplasmic lipoprotein
MKKILLNSIISFVLLGCDADLETTVTMSQLDAEPSLVTGNLLIEVPICSDRQDSTKESSTLIKTKKEITNLFKKVEYKECYSKKMKSLASFEIPILVGKDVSKSELLKQVDIVAAKYDTGIVAIAKQDFRQKLNQFKKNNVSNMNFKVTVSIVNDTDKEIDNFTLTKAYLNDEPYDNVNFSLSKNDKITVTLSDVSTQILLSPTVNSNDEKGVTEIVGFK